MAYTWFTYICYLTITLTISSLVFGSIWSANSGKWPYPFRSLIINTIWEWSIQLMKNCRIPGTSVSRVAFSIKGRAEFAKLWFLNHSQVSQGTLGALLGFVAHFKAFQSCKDGSSQSITPIGMQISLIDGSSLCCLTFYFSFGNWIGHFFFFRNMQEKLTIRIL